MVGMADSGWGVADFRVNRIIRGKEDHDANVSRDSTVQPAHRTQLAEVWQEKETKSQFPSFSRCLSQWAGLPSNRADKIAQQKQFAEERVYFGSQFRQTTMAEKSRRQEPEATSHVASTIVDREWWTHVIVQNPSLYNPGSQSRNDATHSGQVLIKKLYIGLLPTYISGHQVLDWYI